MSLALHEIDKIFKLKQSDSNDDLLSDELKMQVELESNPDKLS